MKCRTWGLPERSAGNFGGVARSRKRDLHPGRSLAGRPQRLGLQLEVEVHSAPRPGVGDQESQRSAEPGAPGRAPKVEVPDDGGGRVKAEEAAGRGMEVASQGKFATGRRSGSRGSRWISTRRRSPAARPRSRPTGVSLRRVRGSGRARGRPSPRLSGLDRVVLSLASTLIGGRVEVAPQSDDRLQTDQIFRSHKPRLGAGGLPGR